MSRKSPMFSHRHYRAIAARLRCIADEIQRDREIHTFAIMFENDNRRFDRALFLKACNYN